LLFVSKLGSYAGRLE